MRGKRELLTIILLLLVVMTTAAGNFVSQRGCRRGTLRPSEFLQRRATLAQPRQVGGDFYKGECHQLVVMVTMKDLKFNGDETATMEQWGKVFNARNYKELPFTGSVHDYFDAQSNGQFDLEFDLIYVELADSIKKYRSTNYDDENSQYLVNDIVDVLQSYKIDWGKYDWNGDGFVNQLMIIYPGKGMNDGGGSNSIWPHQWWLTEHYQVVNNKKVYCSARVVEDSLGKEYMIDCYCALQEIANNKLYGSFGTICHEYTHCFGFPDFYYSGGTKVVGNWDLMDYGNNNGDGFCPPNYSAHQRWLMGWLTPHQLTEAASITGMPALCDAPQAYLIPNDGYANEYYIVENRQQRGWDEYLPGNGIVVAHVDYREDVWKGTADMPNSNDKKRYHIFPANNNSRTLVSSMSGWPYPCFENDSLTNTSEPAAILNNPNTDGTKWMNKSLYDMKVEDGIASFRFEINKTPMAISEQMVDEPIQVLYEIGPVCIVRYQNGNVRKISAKMLRKSR